MRKIIQQLHISYFRDMVKSCPMVRVGEKTVNGKRVSMVWKIENGVRVGSYRFDSRKGKDLLRLKLERDNYVSILTRLEGEWLRRYDSPCGSLKLRHYGQTPNRMLFENLVERTNSHKFKTPVFYNGEPYRSKLEADFARLMDDYGILYKYEPEILVVGKRKKCPDFMIYLPWIDLLILVEICGSCNNTDYLEYMRDKNHEYLLSGWRPGSNMILFYYDDKMLYIPEMVMEEIETVELRKFMSLINK